MFVQTSQQFLPADYFIAQINADYFRHVNSGCLEFISYKH